jgi:hypothetical protein
MENISQLALLGGTWAPGDSPSDSIRGHLREPCWREQHDFGIPRLVGCVGGGLDGCTLTNQHGVNPVRPNRVNADHNHHQLALSIAGPPADELWKAVMFPVFDVRFIGRIWDSPAGVVVQREQGDSSSWNYKLTVVAPKIKGYCKTPAAPRTFGVPRRKFSWSEVTLTNCNRWCRKQDSNL